MGKEVRADFVEMATLGQAFTTGGTDLRTALQTMRESGIIPAGAFGNTPGAESAAEEYSSAMDKAGTAIEDLAETVERGSDNIYQVAFAYQAVDLSNQGDVENSDG